MSKLSLPQQPSTVLSSKVEKRPPAPETTPPQKPRKPPRPLALQERFLKEAVGREVQISLVDEVNPVSGTLLEMDQFCLLIKERTGPVLLWKGALKALRVTA